MSWKGFTRMADLTAGKIPVATDATHVADSAIEEHRHRGYVYQPDPTRRRQSQRQLPGRRVGYRAVV